ncbi:PREDICTED: GPI ethanolamine phosphate transferase 2 [Polistes canadensis]|uniref:GPI ethanolamine phosphate transferase 2 n=1 Tax=Polistes canadensis TaxID=91411 RepID=UPI000718DE4C|nr:PREDICTED: GPI ethanolamine phosphate transferase 2 [Polistes canadensis]
MYKNIRLIYTIIVGTFSIVLFIYGFFPIIHYDNTIASINDIPQFIDDEKIETNTLYKPLVNKLIIMVIDAFRWDFVSDSIGKSAMPITNKLIENSFACLLQAKVEPPTVTMPRIKAMTTGRVPTFVDMVLNFGRQPILSDNILLQAKTYGHDIIFYGDDTWLKLFPTMFKRSDGTMSFFVTDFTEVDNNVTRHIDNELHNDDWSIMILHYLGLDHIGHVNGPFSPLIKPKLTEMDNIIAQIYSKVLYWNEIGNPTLFIICGDHGMKDSGGHGGATFQETTVPIIAIGANCSKSYSQPKKIAQLDMAATLSVILGLPIPYSNFGSIALHLLDNLSISRKLFALYYNAKQVHTQFKELTDYNFQYAHHKYMDAVKLHLNWLKSHNNSYETGYHIIAAYRSALNEMKEILVKNMLKNDTYLMITAMLFLCHVLWILLHEQYYSSAIFQKVLKLFAIHLFLLIILILFWSIETLSLSLFNNRTNCIFILSIIGLLFLNCYFLAKIEYHHFILTKLKNYNTFEWIFISEIIIHSISLSSSSFVEEEHQTSYFFWVSFLVLLLCKNSKIFTMEFLKIRVDSTQYLISIEILLLLIGHRICRTLNSTGNKYNHLPDIAGYLLKEESKISITIFVILALTLLIWIDFLHEKSIYRWCSLFLNIGLSLCIYLRHMNNQTILPTSLYSPSKDGKEILIFWSLFTIFCICSIYRLLLITKHNKNNFLNYAILFLVQTWIMVSALLHRPYNLILLPLQLIVISIINSILKHNNMRKMNIIVNAWIGNVFYFYQGNSNSLADIDIAAGYVGLQSYRPFIIGMFLIVNTYSAPVLAYLLNMYHRTLSYKSAYNLHYILLFDNRIYMIWKLIPVTIYTFVMTIQKHHLFIWSVFAPKLLYESMYLGVMSCTVLFLQTIILIQHIINKYMK